MSETYMFCESIIVPTQTEDEIASLPDVDAITDMLKQKRKTLQKREAISTLPTITHVHIHVHWF